MLAVLTLDFDIRPQVRLRLPPSTAASISALDCDFDIPESEITAFSLTVSGGCLAVLRGTMVITCSARVALWTTASPLWPVTATTTATCQGVQEITEFRPICRSPADHLLCSCCSLRTISITYKDRYTTFSFGARPSRGKAVRLTVLHGHGALFSTAAHWESLRVRTAVLLFLVHNQRLRIYVPLV